VWDNALFVNAVTRADIGLGESYMNGDFSFESGKGLSQSPHSASLIAHTRLTLSFLQSGTLYDLLDLFCAGHPANVGSAVGQDSGVPSLGKDIVGLLSEAVRAGAFPNPSDCLQPLCDCSSTPPSLKGSALHTSQVHCFISQLVTVCPYIAQYSTPIYSRLANDPFLSQNSCEELAVRWSSPRTPRFQTRKREVNGTSSTTTTRVTRFMNCFWIKPCFIHLEFTVRI
jgi:hypothetical protein